MSDHTTDQTAAATDTAAKPAVREKVRTSFDASGLTVTVTPPGGAASTYDLASLPEAVRTALMGKGAAAYLTSHTGGAEAAYKALQDGTYGARQPAKPKELDTKRKAIALALVDHTKKSETPVSLVDAEARAREMNREQVAAEMLHPLVVKHYQKLAAPTSALFG